MEDHQPSVIISSSQESFSLNTPVPQAREFQPPIPQFDDADNNQNDVDSKQVDALVRVLQNRNIKIMRDAATLLHNEATTTDGTWNYQLIDQFYNLLVREAAGYDVVTLEYAQELLSQIKGKHAPQVEVKGTKILNVFRDVEREVWDFQQQVRRVDETQTDK